MGLHSVALLFTVLSHILLIPYVHASPSCWLRGSFCLFVNKDKTFSFVSPINDDSLLFSLTGTAMRSSRHEWRIFIPESAPTCKATVDFYAHLNTSESKLRFQFMGSGSGISPKFLWVIQGNETSLLPWITVANVTSGREIIFHSDEKVSATFQLNRKRHGLRATMVSVDDKALLFNYQSAKTFLLFAEDDQRVSKSNYWFRRSTIVMSSLMLTLLGMMIAMVVVDAFVLKHESP